MHILFRFLTVFLRKLPVTLYCSQIMIRKTTDPDPAVVDIFLYALR